MKVEISDFKNDNFSRDVNVKISDQDVWNLDNTLALIIHPSLIKLKADKKGSPFVFDDDVPEGLKMSESELDEFHLGNGGQDKWNGKWTYILDEMIWTFDQIANDKEPLSIDSTYDTWLNRVSNGLMLFGKYYSALWT
ncbi:hypothetical protein N9043_00920 [bacterium]|nr:hypothetical protein [bacterium]